ncbi:hypothetical protein [Streptomyces yaizuensis]|uniref:Secreted protein n=1 Tax=Streptomyces yaizuensis TaxID=2989713 RepID=A0AA86IXX0_9ACTN|nr:hypothetical protein [Streptomyces sp. YSPA8]BDT39545.1 hypothetical protein SYYSPA8_37135 [Streptomyces sp. YSPA8]
MLRSLATASVVLALVAAPSPAVASEAAPATGKGACGAKPMAPHESKGEGKKRDRKVILAKVSAMCQGTKGLSRLVIDAKLQKKTQRGWKNATRNRTQSFSPVKMGKKYVLRTHDINCQRGTFRVYFRVSGKVDGTMRYGNWGAGEPKKNPCG